MRDCCVMCVGFVVVLTDQSLNVIVIVMNISLKTDLTNWYIGV